MKLDQAWVTGLLHRTRWNADHMEAYTADGNLCHFAAVIQLYTSVSSLTATVVVCSTSIFLI